MASLDCTQPRLESIALACSCSCTPYSSPNPKLSRLCLFSGIKLKLTPTRFNSSNSRPFRFAPFFSSSNQFLDYGEGNGNSSEDDSEFVEVIGIGSRKDAAFDFCLDSPFLSPSLRLWNLIIEDSTKMQLQQFTKEDDTPIVMETPSGLQSCSKAVILVATAAYASDHIRVIDVLKRVKSANGLVVGIIIKPFSFEGQRRQVEVKDLLKKLQEHTNFCIGVDTDVLLEKDLVTLDEALKTANTAILMAINAISILTSESKKKVLDSPQDKMKELELSQIIKILEGYKHAEIGFGAGYNIKTSVMRAIYDCPFLSIGLKDLDGVVICILASSAVIERSEVNAFLHTFRQITECTGQIIMSSVQETNLEPNQVMATVVSVGHNRHQAPQESSLFTRLSRHFPFIFNLLKRHRSVSHDTKENDCPENQTRLEVMELPEYMEMPDIISADRVAEGFGNYSTELQTLLSNNGDEEYNLRGQGNIPEPKEIGFSETAADSSNFCDPNTEGVTSHQREPLIRHNLESVYGAQEESANEGANDTRGTPMLDKLSVFKLPVGVKPSAALDNSLNNSNSSHQQEEVAENVKAQTQITPKMSWNTVADAGIEAVSEFYDSGSAVLQGSYSSISKKEGVLSARAASMLEAERDSQKKWNRIVEMKYRGGYYKGRCQGGLPEGKGRLSLLDGSIYDGMWRYGKRSGLGTFYFSNGDVYQGSWRDDLMHGKGWLYFQTGDRWFVNFWKGKANGEGRFYSKLGEIFFGHFKDGWRHGHFLCISVDGERYLENWDGGVLVSRKQLDGDAAT